MTAPTAPSSKNSAQGSESIKRTVPGSLEPPCIRGFASSGMDIFLADVCKHRPRSNRLRVLQLRKAAFGKVLGKGRVNCELRDAQQRLGLRPQLITARVSDAWRRKLRVKPQSEMVIGRDRIPMIRRALTCVTPGRQQRRPRTGGAIRATGK